MEGEIRGEGGERVGKEMPAEMEEGWWITVAMGGGRQHNRST